MTLLFVDSFDHYLETEYTDKGYTKFFSDNWTVGIGVGRRSGNCMLPNTGVGAVTGSYLSQSFTDSDGVVVGFAWSSEFAGDNILILLDNLGNTLASFTQTAAGEFKITSGGVTQTSATAAYTPNTYSYYECKYVKGTGANGFFEVKKDAVILLTISTSTETAQASAARFLDASVGVATKLDDLYILNTLGGTNNDYLGDVRVDAHFADADGGTISFIPNTGAASWTHVDEIAPDDDTTFVEAGNINDVDLYSVDAASLGTVIYGVQQDVLARKTDAGTVTVDVISEKPAGSGVKENGTTTADDDYKYHLAILETDPDDSTTWNDTKINATEFGFKIDNIVT
jgi:hypothetical protein